MIAIEVTKLVATSACMPSSVSLFETKKEKKLGGWEDELKGTVGSFHQASPHSL